MGCIGGKARQEGHSEPLKRAIRTAKEKEKTGNGNENAATDHGDQGWASLFRIHGRPITRYPNCLCILGTRLRIMGGTLAIRAISILFTNRQPLTAWPIGFHPSGKSRNLRGFRMSFECRQDIFRERRIDLPKLGDNGVVGV